MKVKTYFPRFAQTDMHYTPLCTAFASVQSRATQYPGYATERDRSYSLWNDWMSFHWYVKAYRTISVK